MQTLPSLTVDDLLEAFSLKSHLASVKINDLGLGGRGYLPL